MYYVKKELCIGCAVCLRPCSDNAIYLVGGKAEIDSSLCTECGECADICPRDAIVSIALTEKQKLKNDIESIKKKIESFSSRISQLEKIKK
jgi:ferredoxin